MGQHAPEWKELHYWHWFFKGCGKGRPGYKCLWNFHLCYHQFIGAILLNAVPYSFREAANTVLLPLAGVLIGLSIAWSANAHALLQSKEIQLLARERPGGLSYYVFQFQTAVFVILVTIILWGLAGLNIFDGRWPTLSNRLFYTVIGWLLYTASSIAIREMWHIVHDIQVLLLIQVRIAEACEKPSANGEDQTPI